MLHGTGKRLLSLFGRHSRNASAQNENTIRNLNRGPRSNFLSSCRRADASNRSTLTELQMLPSEVDYTLDNNLQLNECGGNVNRGCAGDVRVRDARNDCKLTSNLRKMITCMCGLHACASTWGIATAPSCYVIIGMRSCLNFSRLVRLGNRPSVNGPSQRSEFPVTNGRRTSRSRRSRGS